MVYVSIKLRYYFINCPNNSDRAKGASSAVAAKNNKMKPFFLAVVVDFSEVRGKTVDIKKAQSWSGLLS